VYIGMDSALAVGHPSVLATSMLLVPATLLLAVILPGNSTLPLGDLATIPYMIALMVAVFRGDILRSFIGGTLYMGLALYISTWATPLITQVAKSANFDLAGNASITVLSDGGIWSTPLFAGLGENLGWIGIGIVFVVTLGLIIYENKFKSKTDEIEA